VPQVICLCIYRHQRPRQTGQFNVGDAWRTAWATVGGRPQSAAPKWFHDVYPSRGRGNYITPLARPGHATGSDQRQRTTQDRAAPNGPTLLAYGATRRRRRCSCEESPDRTPHQTARGWPLVVKVVRTVVGIAHGRPWGQMGDGSAKYTKSIVRATVA